MQLKIVMSVLRLCAFLLNRRGSRQAALAWAGLAGCLLLAPFVSGWLLASPMLAPPAPMSVPAGAKAREAALLLRLADLVYIAGTDRHAVTRTESSGEARRFAITLGATLDEMGRILERLGAPAAEERDGLVLTREQREAVRGVAGRFIAIHRDLAHLALDASPIEARREAIGKAVHLNEVELTDLLDGIVSRLYDEARAAEGPSGLRERRADAGR